MKLAISVESEDDQLSYKSRKISSLYHERCGQFVIGNGSTITPYRCLCGEWKYNANNGGLNTWKLTQSIAKVK